MNDLSLNGGQASNIVSALVWRAVGWGLDLFSHISANVASMIVFGALGSMILAAWLMQKFLNRSLSKDPSAKVSLVRMEFWFSLPGMVALPFYGLYRLISFVREGIRKSAAARNAAKHVNGQAPAPQVQTDAKSSDSKDEDKKPKPVLVVTLGPTFLIAGVVTGLLYVLARIAEPLLAGGLELSRGYPAWQYLFLGSRPEVGWYLPLERFPWMAGLIAFFAWGYVWLWVGRIVRVAMSGKIGVSQLAAIESDDVLPLWRRWFGADRLFTPVPGFLQWAKWLPMAALPLLGWAWSGVGGDPYRIGTSAFAVGAILCASWTIHLILRGKYLAGEGKPEESGAKIKVKGWPDVVAELKERLQVTEPYPFDPHRPITPLVFTQRKFDGVISPMILELLPGGQQLTSMQYEILETISKQAFVHIDPPAEPGRLTIGDGDSSGMQDVSGQRHRNQIVLAPEGIGKTTLAVLAACNQTLSHTQSTLLVVRNSAYADALHEKFLATVRSTTVRWSVRVRKVGPDLSSDLTQGILPDVLVAGLDTLVTVILDQPEVYEACLKRVGLIIVDDAESFAGPVEIHAQLAFRRLANRYRNLLNIESIGDLGAPQMLIVGCDTMHDTATWMKTLCGVDGSVRRYTLSDVESRKVEAARSLAQGVVSGSESTTPQETAPDQVELAVPHQRFLRLADFRSSAMERIDLVDIITICERLSVPWHYRSASDYRRHLGRNLLLLKDEPHSFASDPADAAVVFIEGEWSEVRRECMRLRRAGARFTSNRDKDGNPVYGQDGLSADPEQIAFIVQSDPDIDMALTERNPQSTLAADLKALPRPILRPPEGGVVLTHLSSDLIRGWNEVGHLVNTFGAGATAPVLRKLADGEMLLADPRMDIHDTSNQYEEMLFVRALAKALEADDTGNGNSLQALPPKVVQVEQVSSDLVWVRDRTSMMPLGQTDSRSAAFRYYQGRIFADARGRYVVVGRASDESGDKSPAGTGDILVDPLLADDVSSPRWRHRFTDRLLDGGGGTIKTGPSNSTGAPGSVGGAYYGPEKMLLGLYPIEVGLRPVSVDVELIATYRLGPVFMDPRQRTVFEDSKRKSSTLETVGLIIRPNPKLTDVDGSLQEDVSQLDDVPGSQKNGVPRLNLEQARLIASAMNAVLPSMYRGAASDLGVALDIKNEDMSPDRELDSDEGIVLFDLDPDGNGSARSVHRDGIELLLRLTRCMVERVLYHNRLRALHDQWGDRNEIIAGRDPVQRYQGAQLKCDGPAVPAGDVKLDDPSEAGRKMDQTVRKGALEWLDGHLRPEGGGGSLAVVGKYGSGDEPGEGDIFDIGRCWYSQDESVADLLWTKHRWRLAGGGEAALDVGFDRKTAEQSRHFTSKDNVLASYFMVYDAFMKIDAFKLPDNQGIWGAPRFSWHRNPESQVPEPCGQGLPTESTVVEYHKFATAVAAHSYPALESLAKTLAKSWGDTSDSYGLATYVSRFVQGIPYSVPKATRWELRPPVSTLLYRLGDCDSKSLLLALLLKHCGIESGLFVSFAEGHALCAMSLPAPVTVGEDSSSTHFRDADGKFTSEENAVKPEGEVFHRGNAAMKQIQAAVDLWGVENELPEQVAIWSEMPETPQVPNQRLVYVPIESTAEMDPGDTRVRVPDSWVFLPMQAIWMRFATEENISRHDSSEMESSQE